MFTLIIGGSASGKSEYAEGLLPRGGIYIATMRPWDDECLARIAKHRNMRTKKRFTTIECYTGLDTVNIPAGSDVLIEDIGNLTANELFGGAGDDTAEAVTDGVKRLARMCGQIVAVSNEVFSGGADYGTETVKYMRILGRINRNLASIADNVCEIVCGVPIYRKGAEE
jgi:adenosylcobinamide kinase/adenosylcobinamide-phosphate guanylyltransferase